MAKHTLVIKNGEIHCIYADELMDLLKSLDGEMTTKRARYVEPMNGSGLSGRWRITDPYKPCWIETDYEGRPFETRQQALDHERKLVMEDLLAETS